MDDGHGRLIPVDLDALQRTEVARYSELSDALKARLAEALEKKKEEIEAAHKDHGAWFEAGEIVELKGSRFVIKSIKPNGLYLKLLPKDAAIDHVTGELEGMKK